MALDTYARRYCIEGEAFDRFITFMSVMDEEWLEHSAQLRQSQPE